MIEIKRYRIYQDEHGQLSEEDLRGPWVKFEDHAAALAAKDAELAEHQDKPYFDDSNSQNETEHI